MTQEKKKKWEPPAPPPRVGKKQRKRDAAASLGSRLPNVTPSTKCKLRLLKLERTKDYLLMENEFVQNQEQLKPQDERNEEDRSKVWRQRRVGGAPTAFVPQGAVCGACAAWPRLIQGVAFNVLPCRWTTCAARPSAWAPWRRSLMRSEQGRRMALHACPACRRRRMAHACLTAVGWLAGRHCLEPVH